MTDGEQRPPAGRAGRLSGLALAGLSGAALFVSDYPLHLFPLQLVALVPWLWALDRRAPRVRDALLAGLGFGLCYTLPLLLVLEFPLGMGLPLALYLTLLWMGASVGVRWVRGSPAPWGALATAGVVVLVEWVDYALVPVWGTAQAFVRVWSAAPWAVQFVAATGVAGVVFAIVALQALGLDLARSRRAWRTSGMVLAALLLALGLANGLGWYERPKGLLRVAAAGWTWRDLPRGQATPASLVLEKVFRPLLERAADEKAALVVAPEVAFFVGPTEKESLLGELAGLARRHRLAVVVGYFDVARRENRAVWIDADGRRQADYVKTHLIPFVEVYQGGSGALALVGTSVGAAGLMICQDDNFTDLSRAYARAGTRLMVVPTNDWAQVQRYHYENSRFRALEARYGLVRGASNGTSAIVSGRGEVLAERDHFRSGPGLVVADLPIYAGRTFYARAGEWVVLAAGVLLVLGRWRHRRRGR
ncbi:MAG: hypothetical protein IT371_22565 [Deltaproteobacteria bacterium]|nr:hypothetical protein [Deltaproteobacteria bacterium]